MISIKEEDESTILLFFFLSKLIINILCDAFVYLGYFHNFANVLAPMPKAHWVIGRGWDTYI